MSVQAKHAVTTPILVQLSETEFTEFFYRSVNSAIIEALDSWVLFRGMQWKCLPMSQGIYGKSELYYTNVYRAFAKWSTDDLLQQAFIASVGHLLAEKKLVV
jgi:hypothetical protein